MTPIEDGWIEFRQSLPWNFNDTTLSFMRAVYFAGAMRYRGLIRERIDADMLIALAAEMQHWEQEVQRWSRTTTSSDS